jgi:hypothetical protein
MADSYIYTLPQTTDPLLTDFTVVDARVLSADGYITSKATLLTIAQVTSGTISNALTSQQPIANWNTSYDTVSALSGGWQSTFNTTYATSGSWVDATTVVQSNSSMWGDATTVVQTSSSVWGDGGVGYIISTELQASSANWQSTYETVSALSAAWSEPAIDSQTILQEISADVFDVQTMSTFEVPTSLTATGEFMMVTVNGQPRAIQLWQY